jgi:hypothetical protein
MTILETVIRNQSPTYNLAMPDLLELLKEVEELAPLVHVELTIETSIQVSRAMVIDGRTVGGTSSVQASVRACFASTGHNWDILAEAVLNA